jgi:hypothetical protein
MEKEKIFNQILHRVNESPGRKFIYVFFKHKGHDALTVELVRFHQSGVIVGDIDYNIENAMPVAWCYATELLKLVGYTDELARFAKDYTIFSYKGEAVI